MEPRGAGGATQQEAGRAGGERHGGFVVCLVGGRSRRRGEGRKQRRGATEEATGRKIWCGGGPPRFVEAWSIFASASAGRRPAVRYFTTC